MAISSETIGRLLASGRNYAGQIIAFAGGIGVMSAAQQKSLSEGLGQVVDGVMMVVHGGAQVWTVLAVIAAPIVGPILARWASNSAKTDNQAAAVQAAVRDPNSPVSVEAKASILDAAAESAPLQKPIVVADPVLAQMVPSEKVVAHL
jgi:hypothetical protein